MNAEPFRAADKGTHPARDDATVTDLVTRARNGDQRAWELLVERCSPLIQSVCRKHRVGGDDARDVAQSVWTSLLDCLGAIREPAALPGWLATTTRRECLRVLHASSGPAAGGPALDADTVPDERVAAADHRLLAAERRVALRRALLDLPPTSQQLIALLTADPPLPYAQISAKLGIPVGSIGPSRSRCLGRLRRHPAVAAIINADAS
jgi:RNA polymerase sigma factor (sigma-70 family)